MRYDHKKVEKKWQRAWEKQKLYRTDEKSKKPKFYVLDMFPYPSGEGLHVGHPRGYIGSDVVARYKMMQGYNVLHPMGWDAFGLPAENFAIKNKIHPRVAVEKNIKRYKEQLGMIGFTYDWSREINTTDPAYYKWTQWIFLQLFRAGLAYQSFEPINWCPSCQTGLANEDLEEGKCEQCGSEVERRPIRQWALKMTAYAEKLLKDLKLLDWDPSITEQQKNWIGKSEGAQIDFKLFHERQTHTVFAIVNEKGEVLIERRKGGRFAGKWLFPAGKIEEKDPNMVRAAMREIEEETSLKPNDFAYQGFVGHFHSRPKDKASMLLLVFRMNKGKTSNVKAKTAMELRWQSVSEFPKEYGDEVFARMFKGVKDYVETGRIFSSLISVFTTRADTLFGATYMVLAPEHPLLEGNVLGIENYKEVHAYVQRAKQKSELDRTAETKEKTGVELKGVKAVNPATGGKVPIFVADYVLGGYGTGAIMAVPAHDERDFAFAKKFGLPIVPVVAPRFGEKQGDEVSKKAVISVVRDPKTNRVIVLNWGARKERYGGNMLIGGTMREGEDPETTARREIAEETGYTDLKLIRASDVPGFGYFHSNTKNHNVFVEAVGLYFELVSGTQEAKRLDDGEHGKFTVEWQPVERVAALLDDGIHEYYFRELVLGECFIGEGVLIHSGKFSGMASAEARREITKAVGGKVTVKYKMRDWVFSRQRYWGEPIPIVRCERCGVVPVSEEDLPVKLPEVKSYEPTGTGESPLAAIAKWVNVKCPHCGGPAKRETNTMPQWAGSCWYYLAYIMKASSKFKIQNSKLFEKWLPVDLYVGGVEHATRHLLYARFWHKALYDLGLVSTKEPFKKLVNQGLILAADGRKMSKRWENVVNPDDTVAAHGADSLRLYEMFMGPFGQPIAWSTNGLVGMRRFLERAYRMGSRIRNQESGIKSENVERTLHKSVKKVTEDIEGFRFNTAISALMVLLNEFEKHDSLFMIHYSTFIKLLAPFAPHLAEELWQALGNRKSIFLEAWPQYNKKLIVEDEFDLVIQVNGKVRDVVRAQKGISEKDARERALQSEKVKKFTEGMPTKKTIFVKDRLVNLII